MFQALLAHPQEVILKWHLVYCMYVMPVGCTNYAICVVPPEDEQVMLETRRGP
jgi:hypothetical protein